MGWKCSPRKGVPAKEEKTLRIEMFSYGSCSARGIPREQDNIPAEGCLGAGNVPEAVG